MDYADSAIRQAFVAGAREAVDAAALTLPPPQANELDQWMRDLGCWTEGEPPPGPHRWLDN
jgi:hypothetical protein